jgi:hypothetical protein
MTAYPVERDERTVMMENASYRLAYHIFSFGLLVIVAYRSFVWRESAWDLLGLVVLGGLVPLAYQGSQHVLSSRSAIKLAVAMLVAAIVAAAVVWLRP